MPPSQPAKLPRRERFCDVQTGLLGVVKNRPEAAAGYGGTSTASRFHDHAGHGLPGGLLQHACFLFVDDKTLIAGDVANPSEQITDTVARLCR